MLAAQNLGTNITPASIKVVDKPIVQDVQQLTKSLAKSSFSFQNHAEKNSKRCSSKTCMICFNWRHHA